MSKSRSKAVRAAKALSRAQAEAAGLCHGTLKIRHPSPDSAQARLRRLVKTGYRGECYKCKICGGWHIGHKSPRKSRTRLTAAQRREAQLQEV